MKNKKIIFCLVIATLCSVFFINQAQGQMSIYLQHPPINQLLIEDLWKVTLTNTTSNTERVYLTGSIDESNDGEVIGATSESFDLNPGTKIISPGDLGNISVKYSNSDIENNIRTTGGFQTGNYRICVTAFLTSSNQQLASYCLDQEVNNLSQPVLIYPQNKMQISSELPVFSWLPPSPISRNQFVTYELIIVEILSNQSSYDAMISNLEWFQKKGIRSSIYQYSMASRNFEEGKRYAWKIKAYVNNYLVNESEILEFAFDKNVYFSTYKNRIFKESEYGGKIDQQEFQQTKEQITNDSRNHFDINDSNEDPENNLAQIKSLYENLFKKKIQIKLNMSLENFFSTPIKISNFIFSGSSKIYGQNSNRQGTNQELPRRLGRWEFNPNFMFFKIPVSFVSLLTTEHDASKQSINSFALIFDPNILIEQLKNKIVSKVIGEDKLREYKELKGLIENPESIKNIDLLKEMEKHIPTDPQKIEVYNELKKKVELIQKAKKEIDKLEVLKRDIEEVQNSKDPKLILNKIQKYTSFSGLNKLMLSFRNIGIGTNYPDYSELTIKGVPVTGVNIELNPGIFYIAATGIKNQKAIERVNNKQPEYARKLISGRLGIGQYNSNHFYVTYMYAKDDENSIKKDSLVTPKKNNLFGIETKLSLLKNKLNIIGEISGSLLTRDIRSPGITDSKVPTILKNLFGVNISSSVDYAYSIKSTFESGKTKASIKVGMVGPGFVSLGSPNLRNDNLGIELKFDQILMNNYIIISTYFKGEKDNTISLKRSTTKNVSFGVTAGLNFPQYPSLLISYNPFYQSNNVKVDSLRVYNNVQVLNANSGYGISFSNLFLFTNINFLFQNSKTHNSVSDFTSSVITLDENIGFLFPLNLTLGYSLNHSKFNNEKIDINNLNFSASYSIFKNWTTTAGIDYSKEKKANKTGIYLNANFPIWILGKMDVRAEQNIFQDKVLKTNNYNEFIFRMTFSSQW